jgi:ATP-dependent Lon protease
VSAITLPLFPLGTVLFPGAMLPLHIFEPRYRTLIEDISARTDGFGEFGVVAIRAGLEVGAHGVESLYQIGCTAEVRRIQPYADGRFDILTRGARRFAQSAPSTTASWIPSSSSVAPSWSPRSGGYGSAGGFEVVPDMTRAYESRAHWSA